MRPSPGLTRVSHQALLHPGLSAGVAAALWDLLPEAQLLPAGSSPLPPAQPAVLSYPKSIQRGWVWAPGVVPQRPGCGLRLGRKGKSQAPEDVINWQRFPRRGKQHTLNAWAEVHPFSAPASPCCKHNTDGEKGETMQRFGEGLIYMWKSPVCRQLCRELPHVFKLQGNGLIVTPLFPVKCW